ncbi:MAG: hypothetical protein JWM57_1744 [Phycisphaerales bacterium]|nr:hypothetical protein [Phycisphaerales bacterium]
MAAATRPNVLLLPPPTLYRKLFSAESERRLHELAAVTKNDQERNLTSAELAQRIGDADVVITGWGSPRFTDEVLEAAGRLKLISHSAGSIKFMLPDAALSRGFAVTTVAAAMGPAVAEMCLLLTLMSLRPIYRLDAGMKRGEPWSALKPLGSGDELATQRVGVVGAGNTGRHFVRMLRGLGVETRVFDPYLTAERAAAMDVDRADNLDELLTTCRVIALHAPATPQTHHMIGRRELAMLADGAVLVNTARSALIDTDALITELRRNRISAALDVFDEEPLPADSPLRTLPNLIVTPHVSSHTRGTYVRQGDLVVDEIERFVRGDAPRYAVTPDMLATMA